MSAEELIAQARNRILTARYHVGIGLQPDARTWIDTAERLADELERMLVAVSDQADEIDQHVEEVNRLKDERSQLRGALASASGEPQ